MRTLQHIGFIFFFTCLACNSDETLLVQRHASDEDFKESAQVSPILAEGLELSLWAPGPLLSNAVALTFDNHGAAYIAETSRRKSSDLDIRDHWEWMIDDLKLESIGETQQFLETVLSSDKSDSNQWMEDFNHDGIHDFHDLSVQSEYINKVWDSDQDGRADISQLFADGFNSTVTGVAAGILFFDGQIFLSAAPDLWCLQDKDQDGQAETKKSISHGYGIHIGFAGHDMSGVTIGPDGKIYWSIGDLGVNATGPDGKNWKYPSQGGVMRCNPDGSDFEVFAHGLRNPQELAFDSYGNLISVDNDGDHAGEHERYVHIIEGSDSGWRTHWQYGKYNNPNESYKVWMDEKLHVPHFPGQAAFLTPPLALAYNGPAGLAYNPGTGLSEKWNDYFFASYFTASSANSKIEAFQLSPKGASFEITNIQDVVGGIVPTGITFAPDGALYINDWKDSYSKKPQGRIWKLDARKTDKHPLSQETQILLKEGMSKRSLESIIVLLAHADQRVRLSAQFEMVKRGELTSLISVAKSEAHLMARLHAIWGIGQLARAETLNLSSVTPLLMDTSHHIRAQVARILGTSAYFEAEDELIRLLNDESATVLLYAAEALGKIKSSNAYLKLLKVLEQIEENDPHLRHAIVFALSKIASEEHLENLSNHKSVFVRIGAVVALRHKKSAKVSVFLKDQDELVAIEAARAIHDDFSIPEAMPALAELLSEKVFKNEAITRRAINANLRIGDRKSAQRLVDYAENNKALISMRADALWALGYWSSPPKLDRVTGRYRDLSGHQLSEAHQAIEANLITNLDTKDEQFLLSLIQVVGRLNYKNANTAIAQIFNDLSKSVKIRSAALITLDQLENTNLIKHIDIALSSDDIEIRKLAQDILGSLDIDEKVKLPLFQKILNDNNWSEKQVALTALGKMTSTDTKNYLGSLFQSFLKGQLEKEIELDLMLAIENSSFDELKKLKLEYSTRIEAGDKLKLYQSALYGGNARRGSSIFRNNPSAQCIRCHVVENKGGEVGPDLNKIGSVLSREDLLLSLVSPSARIAPGYGTVSLKLQDDEQIVGILMEDTKDYIILKDGPELKKINKEQINEMDKSPSAMLNTGDVLAMRQIRDLLSYLVSLK